MLRVTAILDPHILHKQDKKLLYAMAYSGYKQLQTRIDEEGCGVVFAALTHNPREYE